MSVIPDLSLITWIILLVLLLVAYRYLFQSKWQNLPPGPPSLPVVGSLPFMGGDIREVFAKMAAKYGDIFTIGIGSNRTVVLRGFKLIKEALTNKAYDGRTDIFTEMDNGRGVGARQGELWKIQRRFFVHALKHFHIDKRPLEMLVYDEACHLVNEVKNRCGVPFDPQALLKKATADVIAVVLFGKRFDYQDADFNKFLDEQHFMFATLGGNNPTMLFKALRLLPGDPFGYHKIKSYVFGWAEQNKKEIELRKRDQEAPGLISSYLRQIPNWKEYGDDEFFEKELVSTIQSMFTAGTDTSATTLSWFIVYILLNPEAQTKIHSEIDDVIGQSRPPTMQDRHQMPYTEATISEVQRICDLVPLSVHATMEDTQLEGYTVPKGTMIIPDIHSVHFDPATWPDPHKFDPTRFLNEDGKYRKREELIPFLIGRRSCLGEALAMTEQFLFVTNLLQKFTFSVPPNQAKPSQDGTLGFTHNPKQFDVLVTMRN